MWRGGVRSRRRPRPVAAGRRPDGGCPGEAEQAARAAAAAERPAPRPTAGISTTLDADTTCAGADPGRRTPGRRSRRRAAPRRGHRPRVRGDHRRRRTAARRPVGRRARRETEVPPVGAGPGPLAGTPGAPGAALGAPLTSGDEGTACWCGRAPGRRRAAPRPSCSPSSPSTPPPTSGTPAPTRGVTSHRRRSATRPARRGTRPAAPQPGRRHPPICRWAAPALVGGDWCETVRLHFGRTLLVVGDVMGHGLESAVDTERLPLLPALHRLRRPAPAPGAAADGRHRLRRGRPQTRHLSARPRRPRPGPGHPGQRRPPAAALIDRDGVTEAAVRAGRAAAGHRTRRIRGRPPTGWHPARPSCCSPTGSSERRGEDIDRSLDRLAALGFAAGDAVDSVLETILGRLDARHAEDDVAVLAARPTSGGAPRHPGRRGGPPTG